jgi:hypothetical protein
MRPRCAAHLVRLPHKTRALIRNSKVLTPVVVVCRSAACRPVPTPGRPDQQGRATSAAHARAQPARLSSGCTSRRPSAPRGPGSRDRRCRAELRRSPGHRAPPAALASARLSRTLQAPLSPLEAPKVRDAADSGSAEHTAVARTEGLHRRQLECAYREANPH